MRYVQEAGIISELGAYVANVGTRVLVLLTPSNRRRMGAELESSLRAGGCEAEFLEFAGEVTEDEIRRIAGAASEKHCDVILGAGGGRVMDAARAAANDAGLRFVIFPTSASTDAPCSAIVIIHNEAHQVIKICETPRNPDLVLVDTAIVSQAPSRYLAAGMGDALSTYYEGRACNKSGALTHAGAPSSRTALAIGKLCLDTLLEFADDAMSAVEHKQVNDALEQVVHACVYLSCMGSENGGTAAAHAINDGFTALPDSQHLLHGELVGFGVLCQMELEQLPDEEKDRVRAFMARVGLPLSLEQMGMDLTEEKLRLVAETAYQAKPMRNMPVPVTPDTIYAAILAAQANSISYLKKTEN